MMQLYMVNDGLPLFHTQAQLKLLAPVECSKELDYFADMFYGFIRDEELRKFLNFMLVKDGPRMQCGKVRTMILLM